MLVEHRKILPLRLEHNRQKEKLMQIRKPKQKQKRKTYASRKHDFVPGHSIQRPIDIPHKFHSDRPPVTSSLRSERARGTIEKNAISRYTQHYNAPPNVEKRPK